MHANVLPTASVIKTSSIDLAVPVHWSIADRSAVGAEWPEFELCLPDGRTLHLTYAAEHFPDISRYCTAEQLLHEFRSEKGVFIAAAEMAPRSSEPQTNEASKCEAAVRSISKLAGVGNAKLFEFNKVSALIGFHGKFCLISLFDVKDRYRGYISMTPANGSLPSTADDIAAQVVSGTLFHSLGVEEIQK